MSDTQQPTWDDLVAAATKQREPFLPKAPAPPPTPPVAKVLTVDEVIDLHMDRWMALLHAALKQQKVWALSGFYPSQINYSFEAFLEALNKRLPPPFHAKDASTAGWDAENFFEISWAPDDLPYEERQKGYGGL